MKTVGIMACIIFQLLLIPFSISQEETKSCENNPLVTGRCFLFWGRMQLYEESPHVRIWRVGTTRVFGIMDDEYQLEGYENVPSDLVGRIDPDHFDRLAGPAQRDSPLHQPVGRKSAP